MATKPKNPRLETPYTAMQIGDDYYVSQRTETHNGEETLIKVQHLCKIPGAWGVDPKGRAHVIAATMNSQMYDIPLLAVALLEKIDNITSDDFAHAAERPEREALRKVLQEGGWL